MTRPGPLAGCKILEIEGIGPGPFAAMTLADQGANVLRIARPGVASRKANPVVERARTMTLTLDFKAAADVARLLQLVERADALIEGFRPGVMERLGLGPDECLSRNPRLVYGRVTGWGRSGPLAASAGHDINYIALTGALFACGTRESGPIPPLNLVGDFGGGGLLLSFGIVCALLEARSSGRGQVVDTAMTQGAGMLMAMIYGLRANGQWPQARAGNMLDGSAYFYTCYQCACGGWVAVGAIEPEFRRLLLQLLGLQAETQTIMVAPDNDPVVRQRLAAVFLSRSRDDWQAVFDGTDACVSPVLAIDEIVDHEHNRMSQSFSVIDGAIHPAPAPRFSRTPAAAPDCAEPVQSRDQCLSEWGLAAPAAH
jgi:alpha-methylacyl-CoA racemase